MMLKVITLISKKERFLASFYFNHVILKNDKFKIYIPYLTGNLIQRAKCFIVLLTSY